MSQFDVFKNTNQATKSLYPLLLDIQHDYLNDLKTTVVIPLTTHKNYPGTPFTKLNPVVTIQSKNFIIITTLLSGIDRSILGDKVCSLKEHRDNIIAALDFLIVGI